MNEIWENKNYSSPIYNVLVSHFIREYDMEKSNISILYDRGQIDLPTYFKLYNAPREYRQKYVGLMILKNSNIQNILNEGVINAKRDLFTANNITEADVLSIKNDAVFIIDKQLKFTEFSDTIKFLNKNTYTSFYRIKVGKKSLLELFYYYDMITDNEVLDVKGINDNKLKLHEDYFIEFLKTLFCSAQVESLKDCIEIIRVYYNQYINYKLDVGNYRAFNSDSMYYLKKMSYTSTYTIGEVANTDKKYVDITYNAGIIKELVKIFSNLYLTSRKM